MFTSAIRASGSRAPALWMIESKEPNLAIVAFIASEVAFGAVRSREI